MKGHIFDYLKKGVRYDGRKLLDYRSISIETGFTKSAEGSARVKFGETDIMVGVKMGVEKPYPDTPEDGNLMVNTELLALSNPEFEPGPPGDQAVELSRIVDRGIRESHAIDTHKLCITPKEEVWSVMIDVCTMNDDGGLIDASALGAMAALKNTTMLNYKEGVVDYETKTKTALPMLSVPVSVTVYKIGEYFIVDPLPDEEKFAEARLTVALNEKNELCAFQKGGEVPLSVDEIKKMIAIAKEKSVELRKLLR